MKKISLFFQMGLLLIALLKGSFDPSSTFESYFPWFIGLAGFQVIHAFVTSFKPEFKPVLKSWRLGYWWILAIYLLYGIACIGTELDHWSFGVWQYIILLPILYYLWYNILRTFNPFEQRRSKFLPNLD